ncbi:MAG: cytochrome c [Polyangiaceae bacterium]
MKAALLLSLVALSACSPDPGPVREWKPADHDKTEQAKNNGGRVKQRVEASDEPELMELTWSKNCQRCHGRFGQGDGPMGPAVNAPDLTKPEFLGGLTDEQMAASIRSGKGKMPPFESLPERAVQLLVKRIRAAGHP